MMATSGYHRLPAEVIDYPCSAQTRGGPRGEVVYVIPSEDIDLK
jgi:hypothetical protein